MEETTYFNEIETGNMDEEIRVTVVVRKNDREIRDLIQKEYEKFVDEVTRIVNS